MDKFQTSLEDVQIAVDQLDQTVEVMSQLIKRIKLSLVDIDQVSTDTPDTDLPDESAHSIYPLSDGQLH